jgi:hypothetical protein
VGMIEVLKAKTELSDVTKCTWTFYLFKLNLKTTSATICRRCINHV